MTPRRQDLRRVALCAAGLLYVLLTTGCAEVAVTVRNRPTKVASICPECGRTNIVKVTENHVTARAWCVFTKADAVVKMVRVIAAQSGSVAIGVTDINASSDAQIPAVVGALGPLAAAFVKAIIGF